MSLKVESSGDSEYSLKLAQRFEAMNEEIRGKISIWDKDNETKPAGSSYTTELYYKGSDVWYFKRNCPLEQDMFPPQKVKPDPHETQKADNNVPANDSNLPSAGEPSEEGSILMILNDEGHRVREIYYEPDGSVSEYVDFVYNNNGKEIREICYEPDGSVRRYLDSVRDDKGNLTKVISRNPDGSSDRYYKMEYDDKGRKTRSITHLKCSEQGCSGFWTDSEYYDTAHRERTVFREMDGSVNFYTENIFDDDGRIIRKVTRKPDGSLKSYKDYEYDSNGNITKIRHRDGTIYFDIHDD